MATILDIDYSDYNSVIKGFTVELVIRSSKNSHLKTEQEWDDIVKYRNTMVGKISKHFNVPLEQVFNDHIMYVEFVESLDNQKE